MLYVEPVGVATQAVAEAAGAAATGGVLSAAGAAMASVVPMGAEEVSAELASAIAAHSAQFLAATGLGVADRGLFAAQVGTSGAVYVASNALSAASLTL
jgi:PE family